MIENAFNTSMGYYAYCSFLFLLAISKIDLLIGDEK